MEKIKRNTIVIGVSVLPRHKEQIEHLITDKGTYKSASEVVQRAIEFYHDKLYPAYVFNETAAGKLKARKLKDLEAQASISPDQLAEELKAVPVMGPDDIKYFRIRGNGNTDRCIPYDSFKEVVKDDDWLISEHKAFIASGGVIPQEFTREIWPRS